MRKLLLLTVAVLMGSNWSMAQSDQSSVEPPSGLSQIEAYSIYYENYRSESYEKAIQFGRWIWQGMPETIEGYPRFSLKTNIGRLVDAYSGVAEQKQDPSVKEAYVDTATMILDKAFEKFADDSEARFDWYIKQGRIYQQFSSLVDNAMTEAADSYYQAYQVSPEKFTKRGDGYYMRIMLQEMVSAGKKDQSLAIIDKSEPYASGELESFFTEMRNKLFESPEERITFLEKRMEENPKNEKVLNQLRDLYQDQDMMGKASEISDKLYEINPNYQNTMAVADDAISNANYSRAVQYLKEAMNKASNDEQRADISLKISNAYLNQEQLQQARQFARQATDYRDGWGQPYIQIADIYARAVSQCTSERKMTRKDKVVYWLVLDYLDRAENVDPNVSSQVQRKYKSYSSVTPTQEEKFFWDPPLKEGDEFAIDSSLMECYGWIDETTTVR